MIKTVGVRRTSDHHSKRRTIRCGSSILLPALAALTISVAAQAQTNTTLPAITMLLFDEPSSIDHPMHPHSIIPAPPSSNSSGARLLIENGQFAVPGTSPVGAFRITCGYSHMAYDDPIVFPGESGRSHLHTFFGNASASAFSTYASLKNSGNSTCAGGIVNRSSYWVPSLYNRSTNQAIAPDLGYIYYKSGDWGQIAANIDDFPDGLRMIAGDANATQDQNIFHIEWSCNESTPDGGPGAGIRADQKIPMCAAGQQLLASISFPQCWDGFNLDSPNHKSHMAYPFDDDFAPDESSFGPANGIGTCPVTHPKMLPHITINVTWTVPAGGHSVLGLASDMPATGQRPGQGLHADFFEAWEPDFRNEMTDHCVRGSADCGVRWAGNGFDMVDPGG